jgi:YidC/Oxa1 family membrane protein insertase
MDTQRIIPLLVFLFSSFMLWEAWQRHQHPERYQRPSASAQQQPSAQQQATPAQQQQSAADPNLPPPSALPAPPSSPANGASAAQAARGERVLLKSAALTVELDTAGGDIRSALLNKHQAAEARDKRFQLLGDQAGTPYYVTQSGLVPQGLPNHNSTFTPSGKAFELKQTDKQLEARMEAVSAEGVRLVKIYRVRNESAPASISTNAYVVDVSFEITNGSAQPIAPTAYFQLLRDKTPPPGGQRFVNTYTGPALFTQADKFKKVSFDDIDKDKAKEPWRAQDGWIGVIQHYFVAAWLPQGTAQRDFYVSKVEDKYRVGVKLPVGTIEPGKSATVTVPLYLGPQEVAKLKALAPGLDFTVDYGWLTVLASPLFWVLDKIHSFVGNWGVAIILLTVLIKLIFFPLSAASYKSMARMKVVAPKLQKMKEQYGDDRQKMSQAMMEMYKKEKINPLGGCLPIAVQIPVFIALYWVLLNAVELRQAPFFGWIKDLSLPDPFYVLPVVMAVSMFIQTKLNPPPPDPVQAKIMLWMPLVFSVMFFFFPAGLVLYWVVNNVLSIAQQWQVMRMYGDKKPGK